MTPEPRRILAYTVYWAIRIPAYILAAPFFILGWVCYGITYVSHALVGLITVYPDQWAWVIGNRINAPKGYFDE